LWTPRFSILTALLLMTIVGLAIVATRLWREVDPLRAELGRLRDEVGALSIDDPAKPCAIEVRTTSDDTWKWRVWIPEGRAYELHVATENIPKKDIPADQGMIVLEDSGEM
jgi:hypothetical protein